MGPKILSLILIIQSTLGNSVSNYSLPCKWPEDDQNKKLSGEFLTHPLIVNSLNQVYARVSKKLLDIPPSTYIGGNVVEYNADPVETCYWPETLCTRKVDTKDFDADIDDCRRNNTWGLTFDDGPSVNLVNGTHFNDTTAVRERLNRAKIKGTFFMTGANTLRFPKEAALLHRDGHQLGIHTWTHHPLTSLTNREIVAELKYAEAAIYNSTGVIPIYVRPPYGDIDDRVRAIIHALGYKIALWTTEPLRDSMDNSVPGTKAGRAKVMNNILSWFKEQKGFVSLQHDNKAFSVGTVLSMIEAIASNSSFPLSIMPIGTCQNDSRWYLDPGNNTLDDLYNNYKATCEPDDTVKGDGGWKIVGIMGAIILVTGIVTFACVITMSRPPQEKSQPSHSKDIVSISMPIQSDSNSIETQFETILDLYSDVDSTNTDTTQKSAELPGYVTYFVMEPVSE